jgi:hypothetical protein
MYNRMNQPHMTTRDVLPHARRGLNGLDAPVPARPQGQWAVHVHCVPVSPAQFGITSTDIRVELPLYVSG